MRSRRNSNSRCKSRCIWICAWNRSGSCVLPVWNVWNLIGPLHVVCPKARLDSQSGMLVVPVSPPGCADATWHQSGRAPVLRRAPTIECTCDADCRGALASHARHAGGACHPEGVGIHAGPDVEAQPEPRHDSACGLGHALARTSSNPLSLHPDRITTT